MKEKPKGKTRTQIGGAVERLVRRIFRIIHNRMDNDVQTRQSLSASSRRALDHGPRNPQAACAEPPCDAAGKWPSRRENSGRSVSSLPRWIEQLTRAKIYLLLGPKTEPSAGEVHRSCASGTDTHRVGLKRLPAQAPLRTVRESFPSHGSSLSMDTTRSRVSRLDKPAAKSALGLIQPLPY